MGHLGPAALGTQRVEAVSPDQLRSAGRDNAVQFAQRTAGRSRLRLRHVSLSQEVQRFEQMHVG